MDKLQKDEVDYSKGMLASHCGQMFHDDKSYCRHFIPRGVGQSGDCGVVAGAILRDHWCDHFKRIGKT
jgi:hypothetical protein